MLGHLGMIPLMKTMIIVRENSEVVIIYPDRWFTATSMMSIAMLVYQRVSGCIQANHDLSWTKPSSLAQQQRPKNKGIILSSFVLPFSYLT